jgi:Protein of unknown function (DUF3738)
MNPALARLLTRLYPRPWGERYRAEFEEFLQTGPGGFGPSMNIVWSALCEHIAPTQASDMDPNPNSLGSLRTLSTTMKHPSAYLPVAMSLTAVGVLSVAALYGIFHVETLRAQLLHPASEPLPSFEVATIRPSHADGAKLGFRMTPAEFKVQNASVTDLIRFAYMVKSTAQLPQAPRWISSDKFDIDAKIAESQIEVMKKLTPDHRFEQKSVYGPVAALRPLRPEAKQPDEEPPRLCAGGCKGRSEAQGSQSSVIPATRIYASTAA